MIPGCRAQRLLVCGWGETPFMVDLLREMDACTDTCGLS